MTEQDQNRLSWRLNTTASCSRDCEQNRIKRAHLQQRGRLEQRHALRRLVADGQYRILRADAGALSRTPGRRRDNLCGTAIDDMPTAGKVA